VREGARQLRAWTEPLVVPAFSTAVFVAGAFLVVNGALPFGPDRRELISGVVPLPLLEVSHLVGSVIGVLLLVLARGLMQRLDAAWAITVLLLGTASLTSMITGFHWELALLLAAIAAPLALARRRFYRTASLFEQTYSWGWLRDIALGAHRRALAGAVRVPARRVPGRAVVAVRVRIGRAAHAARGPGRGAGGARLSGYTSCCVRSPRRTRRPRSKSASAHARCWRAAPAASATWRWSGTSACCSPSTHPDS
jgi:lysylphosphatidylglycerol synthetase-like protein (DUF2156 family)